ncbi:hypothetical protein JW824_02830 [bacterium]|nr:hypothetical protein [bacterium]
MFEPDSSLPGHISHSHDFRRKDAEIERPSLEMVYRPTAAKRRRELTP